VSEDDLLEPEEQEPSEEDLDEPNDADESEGSIAPAERIGLTPPD
jgi:hypothetical protein